MKKHISIYLSILFTLGTAHAAVVGIDFSTDQLNGPGPNMLPGVIGKTTTDVTWNTVGSDALKVGLTDENGFGTGASFQFSTNGPLDFASTTMEDDPLGFFRTYANLAGGGNTNEFTNSFTIAGLEGDAADLYFYATWGWVTAGSEFRVSGDGGTTWSDWTLCEGSPNNENADFVEGMSYVMINSAVHTDGTILGEWQTTTNGLSQANRGPFNALQIDASYADAIAPVFITNSFRMSTATADIAYNADLQDALVSQGSQYIFSNLTASTWLTMAPNGTLGGIPTETDLGDNVFSIQVTDELGRTDTATMTIYVDIVYDRYVDTFDGDGLDQNLGEGGGLDRVDPSASYALSVTDNSENLVFANGPAGQDGAERSAAITQQKYAVAGGFSLDVVYNIVTTDEPAVLSDSAGFGLVDTNAAASVNGLFVLACNANALGVSLTERGAQGVTENSYDGTTATIAELLNDQVSAPGTNLTMNLTVEADGNFSYSLNGAPATSGTTTFDLSKEYHFAIFVQRFSTGLEVQSVSFLPFSDVTEIGDITFETSGTEASFSWHGEPRANYALQLKESLPYGGEAAWSTVTNVVGANTEITVTDEMDKSKAFYRVKLAE